MTPARVEYEWTTDAATVLAHAEHFADPDQMDAYLATRWQFVVSVVTATALLGILVAASYPPQVIAAVATLIYWALLAKSWPTRTRYRQAVVAELQRVSDVEGDHLFGRYVVEFSPNTMSVRLPFARAEYDLSAVRRVTVTPEFTVIRLPGPTPVAIPHTAFADDAAFGRHCEDVRELVRAAGGQL
jgi:hypothetical protein